MGCGEAIAGLFVRAIFIGLWPWSMIVLTGVGVLFWWRRCYLALWGDAERVQQFADNAGTTDPSYVERLAWFGLIGVPLLWAVGATLLIVLAN